MGSGIAFLAAGYATVFAGIFLYTVYLRRHLRQLEAELDELRQLMGKDGAGVA